MPLKPPDPALRKEFLTPTSLLTESQQRDIEVFLKDHPLFGIYFHCALDDLRRGLDNRAFYLNASKRGMLLSIRFDPLRVLTAVGELNDEELRSVLNFPEPIELHIQASHSERLITWSAERLIQVSELRYYRKDGAEKMELDPRCRLLTASDLDVVTRFYNRNYPQTIFSPWMLEHPFVGLFIDGELRAAGGTIVSSEVTRACIVGNFLTDPAFRGKGLAKALAQSLLGLLAKKRITTYFLTTTESNEPAWRAYEAIGFQRISSRLQLDLGPARNPTI